jgi:xanthine dehydrogenase large subunit
MPEFTSSTATRIKGGIREPLPHDSGAKHVSGEAVYIDDIVEPLGCLHVFAAMSTHAHARLKGLDVSAVRAAPGVACVLTAEDIHGQNDVSPTGTNDDPCLADGIAHFLGQPLFAVAAESIEQARAAAALAMAELEPLDAILTIEDAMAKRSFVLDPHTMRRGNPEGALNNAPRRLSGRTEISGQDHFYLEGQVSMAVPMEDGDVLVHCSTQHPTEMQHNIAKVLGRPDNAVTVEVRRMGGGFGGKETQAS